MLTYVKASSLPFLLLGGLILTATTSAAGEGSSSQSSKTASQQKAQVVESYGKLPLSFEPNQGQADPSVKFLSRGSGYSLFLTDSGAILALTSGHAPSRPVNRSPRQGKALGAPGLAFLTRDATTAHYAIAKKDVIRMELAGSNKSPHVAGADQLPGTANYFIGNDPAKWHTSVPTYSRVRYSQVYPGIDLVYYGNQRQLEYDFVLAPGADPSAIRLRFAGAKALRLGADGDWVVNAADGTLAFHKPLVYQMADGQRRAVEGSFVLLARDAVGFQLGSYDRGKPLVIDPVLVYSTYLGGRSTNLPTAIAVDGAGNVYLAGKTGSWDFPVTPGAFQKTNKAFSNNCYTAFVTKLNPTGTALVYSTFLGGDCDDSANGLAVDGSGNAFITGTTSSTDFPVTQGAFQTTNRGYTKAFVTKLNPAGSALVYSTYLGGSGGTYAGDSGYALALDSSGDAYIAGASYSADFPVTPGAFQTKNKAVASGGPNAFLTKLNPTGSRLVYSTYLGGSNKDSATGIAVGGSGNAYITGWTSSSDFPVTQGAFQTSNHAPGAWYGNAFVAKLNPAGTALVYSTYLGGDGHNSVGYGDFGDGANALALDASGDAYIAGFAESADFPITDNAFQTMNHAVFGADAFVAKLNPAGSALAFSTFLGGSGVSSPDGTYALYAGDAAYGLALDKSGNAIITGSALSTDFPVTPGAYQTLNNAAENLGVNAFVTKLNSTGSALIYSTYLGGSDIPNSSGEDEYFGDGGYGLAVDVSGKVYVTGIAYSTDFPVTNGAFQTRINGGENAFISKLDVRATTTTRLNTSANPAVAGATVTFTAEVTPTTNAGTPTGNAVFSVDGKSVATVSLNSAAKASYSTSSLAIGRHVVNASYGGNSTFAPSSASLTETITQPQAAPPAFSPAVGTYDMPVSVTLSDATTGATIYYTTNKTIPTTSSTRYKPGNPIKVTQTTTIKAIAAATGHTNSIVASGAYHITPSVTTKAATGITASGAVLHGTVTANNATTQYWFGYGTISTDLTHPTAKTSALTGTAATPVTATLIGLKSNTTYYFRAVASNVSGTSVGDVLSFKTR